VPKDGKWYITWTTYANGIDTAGGFQIKVRWDSNRWIEDETFAGKFVGYRYGNNIW
jgi:hypothetical protein